MEDSKVPEPGGGSWEYDEILSRDETSEVRIQRINEWLESHPGVEIIPLVSLAAVEWQADGRRLIVLASIFYRSQAGAKE